MFFVRCVMETLWCFVRADFEADDLAWVIDWWGMFSFTGSTCTGVEVYDILARPSKAVFILRNTYIDNICIEIAIATVLAMRRICCVKEYTNFVLLVITIEGI